jgi:Kef-type K+ transport system membrane component KefB
MENIFFELGIILIIATLLALILRSLKQPPIIAYIITGLLLGPLVLNLITTQTQLQAFAQIGIAFLLFTVGLNLNINLLREVGKVSLYTGIGQVLFTTLIGYMIILKLGFSSIEALYMAIALAFSSTIIIVKLLSDKQDLETLYGKISLGFLLVQDAVAVLILIMLSSVNTNQVTFSLGQALINGAILCVIAYIAAKFFLTKFFERVAREQETLFLSAISWCFAMSLIAYFLGFTIEIGAFLAGISLAALPYSMEITTKVKPLRNFFIVLFFVSIGSSLVFVNFFQQLPIIIMLSAFVLIGNPLIVMIIMGIMGFKSRTGFLAGLTVAQISEFSLILAALGYSLGHLSLEVISLISAVGIITIAISTYMITHNEKLYAILAPYLKIFERKKLFEKNLAHHKGTKKYDVILMGQHRIGYSILKNLQKKKSRILVIDFNPTIITNLIEKKIPCLYGDIADPDILKEIKRYKPKMIICTIHTFEDNLMVTKTFRKLNKDMTIIVTASTIQKALDMYAEGADYVIIPHILGGERVSDMLKTMLNNKKKIKALRNKHIKALLDAEIPQQ